MIGTRLRETNLRIMLLVSCGLALLAGQVSGQTHLPKLPKGAVLIETRNLGGLKQGNRALILWMVNPKKNPNNYAPDEIYTCPDQTRGSYYSGPTKVSLINSATGAIINTIDVKEEDDPNFDVPYAIRKGYYYRVQSQRKSIEVKPTILWLRDYNGDGRALEFALFDAPACMGLQTTLIGYSEKQDRVINYPIRIAITEGKNRTVRTSNWVDYLFSHQPQRPGYWKYEVDYTGRGGSLDKWEVRYNRLKEQFEASLIIINEQP